MNIDTSGDPKVKKSDTAEVSTVNNKPRLLTKPAKVLVWTKDLTLETYIKQIQSWSDVLEEIPEHVKYADLIESLKTNKDTSKDCKNMLESISFQFWKQKLIRH